MTIPAHPAYAALRSPVWAATDRAELLVSAVLAAGAAWVLGPRPLLAGLLWLAVVTPRLIAVDQAQHRLPDAIVLPGVPLALAAVALDAAARGADPVPAATSAALYAGALLALYLGGGMGLGDVKLALPLGLLTGACGAGLASPLLALAAGGVWASVVLARQGRGARMAFGPAMLLGAWGAILAAA